MRVLTGCHEALDLFVPDFVINIVGSYKYVLDVDSRAEGLFYR